MCHFDTAQTKQTKLIKIEKKHKQNNAQHDKHQSFENLTVFSEHITQEKIQTELTNNIKFIPLLTTIATRELKEMFYIPIDYVEFTVNALFVSGALISVLDKKEMNKIKTRCPPTSKLKHHCPHSISN